MLNDPQDIVDSFGPQKYFGNVHELATLNEGGESVFFVQLKPKFPQKKEIQIAVLWRLLQTQDSSITCMSRSDDEHQEVLRASFEYISKSWPPRKIVEKDTTRIKVKIHDCQISIDSTRNKYIEKKDAHIGYYQNGKKKGLCYPQDVKSKIDLMNSGFVLVDHDFEFMLVAEQNGVYSLFYWFWGA